MTLVLYPMAGDIALSVGDYSKRRQQDQQVLHPEVAKLVSEWLEGRTDLSETEPLFPVSGAVPRGIERKTAKMMRVDLAAARSAWLKETKDEEERAKREQSDFLKYHDSSGRYADFHANRHTFISNLSKANVAPKIAQSLARHSDIRLTMGTDTHLDLADHTTAIGALPAPPSASSPKGLHRKKDSDNDAEPKVVLYTVPQGVQNGA